MSDTSRHEAHEANRTGEAGAASTANAANTASATRETRKTRETSNATETTGATGRPDDGSRADSATGTADRGRTGRRSANGSRTRRERTARPPGRADHHRTLRRQAPTVLGLIPDDTAFAAMTAHPGFPFDDYADYLRHVDRFLRRLDSDGTHVRVTLFDPDDYADYCESTGQPPGAPATHARYTAEATTTGPGVRYTRQALDVLRDELTGEAARRATWEDATDLLLDAGSCPQCGQDLAHCAFDHASQTLLRIVDILGPGTHHVVASLPVDGGPPLTAAAHIDAHPDGSARFAEPDALVLCTVMAATTAVRHAAGLAVRTTAPDGTETVRGWSLRGGEPRPLTEAQVFDAYCTDPATGEPVPPEPGLRYAAGFPVPPAPPAAPVEPPPPADAG